MNTEYVALHEHATVADAMEALRGSEDLLETLNTLFLVDEDGTAGRSRARRRASSWPRQRNRAQRACAPSTLIKVSVDEKQDRVTELFDKYNILTLPVVDEEDKLVGVITADDIISVLRQK